MNVQERIRELMDLRGWSEYKLAKTADLPQATISHLFRKNYYPSVGTIEAICKAFSITPAQFFADEGEAVPLTKEQFELLLLWGSATKEQQQIIIAALQNFKK